MTVTARKNSPRVFVDSISSEALQSAAVNHPYLQALRNGSFPDMDFALKDFAVQYGLYSAHFMRYMTAVIKNLESESHRHILEGNLAEEQGHVHDVELPPEVLASIAGVSHSCLYGRFKDALGIDAGKQATTELCPGARWRREFLELCETSECVGAGAIGIGTEFIVSRIFAQILDGLKAHSNLTLIQRVFFDLHSECDDKHAEEMMSITIDLATDSESCAEIQHGVRSALALRAAFWDQLLLRAQNMSTSTASQERPAVGHPESL